MTQIVKKYGEWELGENECSICGDPAFAAICGGTNCGYCGNEVRLCKQCLRQLQVDVSGVLHLDS